MMKSMDLSVGGALYLYTICLILPDSSDFLPYKESLFLWLCIEPPRHAWRRPAIQQRRLEEGDDIETLGVKESVPWQVSSYSLEIADQFNKIKALPRCRR